MADRSSQPAGQPSPAHDPKTCTPAETASRYRQAAAHLRDLSAHADYDACADTQDEMTMCRCQLAAAGRLDLIGAGT